MQKKVYPQSFKDEVVKFYSTNHTINSDEIVKAEIVDDGLDICVESDLTGDYHHIIINAQNITVIRNKRP